MIITRPEWTFGILQRPKRLQAGDNWCHLCGVNVSGSCPLCPDCLRDENQKAEDWRENEGRRYAAQNGTL